MRDSMIFYSSFLEAVEMLPENQQLDAFKAIMHYAIRGENPTGKNVATAIFMLAKPQIDANNYRYDQCVENGKRGGRPKTYNKPEEKPNDNQSKTESKPNDNQSKTESKPNDNRMKTLNVNDNVNDNVNVNDNDNVNVNEEKKENSLTGVKEKSPSKHKYGEYKNVFLTDEEYSRLQGEYSTDFEDRIERLSAYMASTGKSYKNHLATIRNWDRMDRLRGSPVQEKQKSEYESFMADLASMRE